MVVIKPLRAMLVHPVNLVVAMVVLVGLGTLAMEETVDSQEEEEAVVQPLIMGQDKVEMVAEAK